MKSKGKIVILSIISILLLVIGTFLVYKYFTNISSKEKETIFKDENIVNAISFSSTEETENKDETAIAYLTIEEIGLKQAPIREGIDDKTLSKYIGHFPESAFLEGNVALAGHNRRI